MTDERPADGLATVVFDCGDTLLRLSPKRTELLAGVLAELGVEVAEAELGRAYELVDFGLQQKASRLVADAERREFFTRYNTRLAEALGLGSLAPELDRRLEERVRARRNWVADAPTRAMLAALAERLPLHVLANWDASLSERLRSAGIAEYFVSIHASQELGCEKPDPGIFAAFAAATGVEPARAVYVGNEYVADVQGARGAGIAPILWDAAGRYHEAVDCLRIRSWDELAAVVDALLGGAPLSDLRDPPGWLRPRGSGGSPPSRR